MTSIPEDQESLVDPAPIAQGRKVRKQQKHKVHFNPGTFILVEGGFFSPDPANMG